MTGRMTLLCRIVGHRWREFLPQEQCCAPYFVCIRCDQIRHGCNEIRWGAKLLEPTIK